MLKFAQSRCSSLRYPGLAQTGEISGFGQAANFRHPPRFDGPQACDGGVTIVADQPASFGEFGGGAAGLVFESMGRGQERAELWVRRSGIASSFTPEDRFVDARPQQMRAPDPAKEKTDLG